MAHLGTPLPSGPSKRVTEEKATLSAKNKRLALFLGLLAAVLYCGFIFLYGYV